MRRAHIDAIQSTDYTHRHKHKHKHNVALLRFMRCFAGVGWIGLLILVLKSVDTSFFVFPYTQSALHIQYTYFILAQKVHKHS